MQVRLLRHSASSQKSVTDRDHRPTAAWGAAGVARPPRALYSRRWVPSGGLAAFMVF